MIHLFLIQTVELDKQLFGQSRPAVHGGKDIGVTAKGVDDAAENVEIAIELETFSK